MKKEFKEFIVIIVALGLIFLSPGNFSESEIINIALKSPVAKDFTSVTEDYEIKIERVPYEKLVELGKKYPFLYGGINTTELYVVYFLKNGRGVMVFVDMKYKLPIKTMNYMGIDIGVLK